MHLHARYSGPDVLVHAAPAPPFGPGFTADQIADADTLEVWVTTLADIADTTVWRLLRAGQPVAMAEVGGL